MKILFSVIDLYLLSEMGPTSSDKESLALNFQVPYEEHCVTEFQIVLAQIFNRQQFPALKFDFYTFAHMIKSTLRGPINIMPRALTEVNMALFRRATFEPGRAMQR